MKTLQMKPIRDDSKIPSTNSMFSNADECLFIEDAYLKKDNSPMLIQVNLPANLKHHVK
jgi:hypothetical protein